MTGDRAETVLTRFLEKQDVIILDGALATELERRGANLGDDLWSAKLLLDAPALIRQVHYDYFKAGADVAISASYQATFEGFARRGLGVDEAARLMCLSVELALEAREQFWDNSSHRAGRQKPLVAASVGPYGAYLANGSEYSGDYGLSLQALMDFHGPRLEVLANSGADLLACETVPSLLEIEALVRLLEGLPNAQAWLSCHCRDAMYLGNGEPFRDVVELANTCHQVVAVGVNCTAPQLVEPLLLGARDISTKPLLAYPNRGEVWDAARRCWVVGSGVNDLAAFAHSWYAAGARLIGGCCRTTPMEIRAIATTFAHQIGASI